MNDNLEFGTKIIEIELPGGTRGLKGDTGAQGPQGDTGAKGDKGDKGDSGVWVGETTPVGDYDVWVDPEGTESTIPTKLSQLEDDATHRLVTDTEKTTWDSKIDNTYHDSTKQDTLVSGTNIKTINNTSILGSGNIYISEADYDASWVEKQNGTSTDVDNLKTAIENGNLVYIKEHYVDTEYTLSNIRVVDATVTEEENNTHFVLKGNDYELYASYDGTNITYSQNTQLYLPETSKVTSISSSSTDYQIPSAKAVYDAIQAALGNE